MATEPIPLDVADVPELLRAAVDVERIGQPRVLRRGDHDLAILTPVPRRRGKAPRRHSRDKPAPLPYAADDPIWNIVGLVGPDDGLTDVSANKIKYLADAYQKKRE